MTAPTTISEDELLFRAFSVPSGLDEENRATPLAFRLKKGEKDLSLCRKAICSLEVFLKKAFFLNYRHLSPFDVFGGVAELLAREVEAIDPKHVVLRATPNAGNPAHASIYFFLSDGTQYVQSKKTTEPTDPSILGYELALSDAVRVVYDIDGNVIWKR